MNRRELLKKALAIPAAAGGLLLAKQGAAKPIHGESLAAVLNSNGLAPLVAATVEQVAKAKCLSEPRLL